MRTAIAVVVIGVVVVVGATLGYRSADPPARLPEGQEHVTAGVNRPLALPAHAAAALLRDDAPVLGVVAGGRARAYTIEAMNSVARHVVNDTLDGVPVTVTYCDRTGCARAYAGGAGGDPLGVGVLGFDRGLILSAGGRSFRQDTGEPVGGGDPFPYPSHPVERTTWGAWRAAHPDTDVYVGDEQTRPGL